MDQPETEHHGPITDDGQTPYLIIQDPYELATELATGVTLYTRDGSKIGNAIVLRSVGGLAIADQPAKVLWEIETDFGNKTKLTTEEINELFTLGRQTTFEEWWDDRMAAIEAAVRS